MPDFNLRAHFTVVLQLNTAPHRPVRNATFDVTAVIHTAQFFSVKQAGSVLHFKKEHKLSEWYACMSGHAGMCMHAYTYMHMMLACIRMLTCMLNA